MTTHNTLSIGQRKFFWPIVCNCTPNMASNTPPSISLSISYGTINCSSFTPFLTIHLKMKWPPLLLQELFWLEINFVQIMLGIIEILLQRKGRCHKIRKVKKTLLPLCFFSWISWRDWSLPVGVEDIMFNKTAHQINEQKTILFCLRENIFLTLFTFTIVTNPIFGCQSFCLLFDFYTIFILKILCYCKHH